MKGRCSGYRETPAGVKKETCAVCSRDVSLTSMLGLTHFLDAQKSSTEFSARVLRWAEVITFSKRLITHGRLNIIGVYRVELNFCISKNPKYI